MSYHHLRVRLASEDFLPPVNRFNDIAGPLFKMIQFPLDEHSQSGLRKSLTWFLSVCFEEAKADLKKLEPPMDALHAVQIRWQNNLQYLRQHYNHFLELLNVPSISKNPNYTRQDERALKNIQESC